MQKPALIIMIKNPVAGKVKTRLAEDVGKKKALKMYRRLLEYTREQTLGLKGVTRYLLYSESVDTEDDWPNREYIKLVQVGDDLGARMAAAMDRAFARRHDRVVVIGSDCPGITSGLLEEAFDELETHELVIGPANDGGYYLIGMRHPHPELFADMEWSTDTVSQVTMARAQEQGLSYAELSRLSDVDRLEDWLSYGWKVSF